MPSAAVTQIITQTIACSGSSAPSSRSNPPPTHSFPANRCVRFQFSSLPSVQETLTPSVLFRRSFGRSLPIQTNSTPSSTGTIPATSGSLPSAARYIMPLVTSEQTGRIQKTIPSALGLWRCCFGSRRVNHRQIRCTSKCASGRPKTASAFAALPSAFPSAPQWVISVPGSLFHTISPNRTGSRITADDKNSFLLFSRSMAAISFQIRKPEHRLLQNGGVDFIINKLSLPGVADQVRLLQH